MPFFAQHTRTALLAGAAFTAVAAVVAPAWAAPADVAIYYDLKPQSLEAALHIVAERSGRAILAPTALLAGKQAPALHGRFTALDAYKALLVGSGLQITLVGDTVIVHASEAPAAAAAAPVDEGAVAEIVVTGSHIRGEASAAPTDIITSKEIDESGYSQVGDVIRSLPENFGGGQNPGVQIGAGVTNIGNQNTTNASSVNLRGLGSDATLVLLDGHRLAADGGYQAPDVSVIPLDAIDRIEIVTDGASALYGADAVAGVANFILKQNYQGMELSERLGNTTEGGGFEQTYNVLGGQTWSGGHILAGVQYTHQDEIAASQRSFTSTAAPIDPLLQAETQTSEFLNVGLDLTPWATFHLDALYAKRLSGESFETTTKGPIENTATPVQSFLAAPSVSFVLPGDWSASLDGSISGTMDRTGFLLSGAPYFESYKNNAKSAELSANGTVVQLPMGPLKLAIGGGYLGEGFTYADSTGNLFQASRTVASMYGEAAVPLIAPSETRSGLHALDLTLAGRAEHYSDFGSTANPKVGLRYVPATGVTLRATWGTSFKAPQFLQEAESRFVFQYPAAEVGSSAPGTALLTYGGNPDLKPERSNAWTAGVDWAPPTIRGLKVSLTYFHIDYRDRIVQPIGNVGDAVSDPIYAPFVTLNPTQATQAAALAGTTFLNLTATPYNPSSVVALIDDQYLNATSQKIQGVDLSIRESMTLSLGQIEPFANATWLNLVQQTLPNSAPETLTGTLFNPPTFRARGGATWSCGSFTATGVINYISGETDNGVTPSAWVDSWTTADLNLAYRFDRPSARLPGLEVALAVSNLFDQAPPYAKGASDRLPGINYDSTNYSAVGRFVALTLRQRF